MKKLFLAVAIMLTAVLTAQVQDKRVYKRVAITVSEKTVSGELPAIIYLNYGNENVIKFAPEGLTPIYYDLKGEIRNGLDDTGIPYSYGSYKKRDTGVELYIQVYDDPEFGIRFIYEQAELLIHYF